MLNPCGTSVVRVLNERKFRFAIEEVHVAHVDAETEPIAGLGRCARVELADEFFLARLKIREDFRAHVLGYGHRGI